MNGDMNGVPATEADRGGTVSPSRAALRTVSPHGPCAPSELDEGVVSLHEAVVAVLRRL